MIFWLLDNSPKKKIKLGNANEIEAKIRDSQIRDDSLKDSKVSRPMDP